MRPCIFLFLTCLCLSASAQQAETRQSTAPALGLQVVSAPQAPGTALTPTADTHPQQSSAPSLHAPVRAAEPAPATPAGGETRQTVAPLAQPKVHPQSGHAGHK